MGAPIRYAGFRVKYTESRILCIERSEKSATDAGGHGGGRGSGDGAGAAPGAGQRAWSDSRSSASDQTWRMCAVISRAAASGSPAAIALAIRT